MPESGRSRRALVHNKAPLGAGGEELRSADYVYDIPHSLHRGPTRVCVGHAASQRYA